MRRRNKCAAIVGYGAHYKVEKVQLCQNSVTALIKGVGLCGTHINAVYERPQLVVATLEIEEDA